MKQKYSIERINQFADVLFTNGRVITVNSSNDIVDTVAVKENRIIFCGRLKDAEHFIGPETEEIDLKGRTLMPGFIDSHMHFQVMSLMMKPIIYLPFHNVRSVTDIQRLVKERASVSNPDEWVVCMGYDENKLDEKRPPTREELDAAAPDNPVRVGRRDGHSGVLNSKALDLVGYRDDSNLPEDEAIKENGRLIGLLKETTYTDTSAFVRFRKEDLIQGIKNCSDELVKNGITTVHDAGVDGPMAMQMVEHASREGLIKPRLYMMIADLSGVEQTKYLLDCFIRAGVTTGFGNDHFSFGPVKVLTDGSSSGPTCVMKEPFSHNPDLKGFQLCTPEESRKILEKAHETGYQITGHAQGDYSIEKLIDVIDSAIKQNPRNDCRPRIEHAGLMNPELIRRMKETGIIPTPNPGFIEVNGSDYKLFYGDRVNYMYPLKSYLDNGIKAAIGSDAPVNFFNPMLALYGAVTRKDSKTGEVIGEDQRIGMLDAIRMYTYNGAYASFEEDKKGSIEPGKFADLIVLSEDILSVDPENLKEVKVDMTMIDGEILYTR